MKKYWAMICTPASMYMEYVEAETFKEAEVKMQEKLKKKNPRLYADGWKIQPDWRDDVKTGMHFDKVVYDN